MIINKYKNIHVNDCIAINYVITHPLNILYIKKYIDKKFFYYNGKIEEYINIYKAVENNDINIIKKWFNAIKTPIYNWYKVSNKLRMTLVIHSFLKAIIDDNLEITFIFGDNEELFKSSVTSNSHSLLHYIRKYINEEIQFKLNKNILNTNNRNKIIQNLINKLDLNYPSFTPIILF